MFLVCVSGWCQTFERECSLTCRDRCIYQDPYCKEEAHTILRLICPRSEISKLKTRRSEGISCSCDLCQKVKEPQRQKKGILMPSNFDSVQASSGQNGPTPIRKNNLLYSVHRFKCLSHLQTTLLIQP